MVNTLSGKRIFIFEDNPENRVITRFSLSRFGVVVQSDHSGREAIRKLKQFAPVDLIIMDLMMGMGSDGFTIAQEIRQDPALANIPILAVSATDSSTAIPRCREMGFIGFVSKPINDDRFPDQVAKAIAHIEVWDDEY